MWKLEKTEVRIFKKNKTKYEYYYSLSTPFGVYSYYYLGSISMFKQVLLFSCPATTHSVYGTLCRHPCVCVCLCMYLVCL